MVPARTFLLASLSVLIAGTALVADGSGAFAYQVKRGDTLWDISRRTGVSIQDLASRNGIADPNHIYAGQNLDLAPPAPAPRQAQPAVAASVPVSPISRPQARALLVRTAQQQGVDPNLVLALAMWESGWNQAMVSSAGAVGMMQVTPGTASWAGPALLHRKVDVHNATDNAAVGTALLRRYQGDFHDQRLVLAAYYQGEAGTRKSGVYPSSKRYVDGILALRARYAAGTV
jgi:soluble lytic murein transglycosylase-like protein